MKDIGKRLQTKRRELKLSYEDIAKMTRMSSDHIRAIEDGDFDYFKDDLTYLRFYVRAYCKVLDVPFEEVKGEYNASVDEYTQTLSMKSIKETEEIEESINSRINQTQQAAETTVYEKRDRGSIKQNVKQGGKFGRGSKVDMSLISLLGIVVIVIGILVWVLFSNVLTGDSKKTTVEPKTTQKTPDPEKEKEKEKKKEPVKKAAHVVTMKDPLNYEVTGLKTGENVKIEITFNNASWYGPTLNNVAIPSMPQKTAAPGDVATYEGPLGANDIFVITIGKYAKDEVIIKINDVVVDNIDTTVGTVPTLYFTFIGE